MPKETAGYFQIKSIRVGPDGRVSPEDLQQLNFILRSLQDRIDALGGNRGQWPHEDATNMNTHKIINVVDPTDDQDAATKNYVDDQFAIRGL